MDASRLLEVLFDIEEEFSGGYSKLLQGVVQAYANARDNPGQDFSAQIAAAHATLADCATKSVTNNYPPTKQRILEAIGGSGLVGEKAERALRDRLMAVHVAGAALVTQATEFAKEAEQFRKACAQTKTGLRGIGIESHRLEPRECEVGVLIPSSITGGTLDGFRKQVGNWNFVLKTFAEAAGEPEPEISLKGLAATDPEVYLAVGVITATFLSKAIDKILAWYKQILEIQQIRQMMTNAGGPPAEVEAAKKYEKELLEKAVRETVEELMRSTKPPSRGRQKEELETHMLKAVERIAIFVDKGGYLQVTMGIPPVPEEPVAPEDEGDESGDLQKQYMEKKKQYESDLRAANEAREISRRGAVLKSLPPRDKPVLQLDEAEDTDNDTAETKTKRKQGP